MSVLKQMLVGPKVEKPQPINLNPLPNFKSGYVKAKPKPRKNPETHIVAKTLKLKKAHVKKGTNIRMSEHQIEAMNKTMTSCLIAAVIVSAIIGTAVGFFVAKKFYQQSSFAAYQNGVRAGIIQRDLSP